MQRICKLVLVISILVPVLTKAQPESDKYMPDKPGKWSYSNNITRTDTEYIAFSKTLAFLAEWFQLNVPVLHNPKGFDLAATTYGQWDKYYQMNKRNYGLRTEMDFSFQLFFSGGGKWTIEPPHYAFDINNTESGHGTNPNYNSYNELEDDPSLEKSINDAAIKMNEVFVVFPLVKSLAPGVNYYDCDPRTCGSLVVFNPARPDFWIPLTLRELADIHLEYYKIRNKTEMDLLLFQQLEKEISELTSEELEAPAFSGHDSHFVLKANGNGEGLQMMRFNHEYFNRSLPPSAIQFMTFYYSEFKNKSEKDSDAYEHFKNNGYLSYRILLNDQVDWGKLAAEMIVRKP